MLLNFLLSKSLGIGSFLNSNTVPTFMPFFLNSLCNSWNFYIKYICQIGHPGLTKRTLNRRSHKIIIFFSCFLKTPVAGNSLTFYYNIHFGISMVAGQSISRTTIEATKTLSENACRAFFMFTVFDVPFEITPFNTIDNGLFMTFTFVYFCASDLLMSSTGTRSFGMTLLNKCPLDTWFICKWCVISHVPSVVEA